MRVADIDREIETAKAAGTLRDIVIQPCPALLTDLRVEFNREDPEPATIAKIASRDVGPGGAPRPGGPTPPFFPPTPPPTRPRGDFFATPPPRRPYAMGYTARQMYGINADIAHTCGLFCHVGLPIMLQGLPGYEATLAQAMQDQQRTFTQVENYAHRTDHAVVGAIVAKTWRLPPIVAIAVRLHHDFTVLRDDHIPAEVRTLVAMSLLAEHLVALHEGQTEHVEWDQYGAACLAHLHVSEVEIEHWLDALQAQFEGPAGF